MGDFMGFSPLTTKVEALSHDVRIKKLLTELNDPGAAPLIRLHNEILVLRDYGLEWGGRGCARWHCEGD